MPNYRRNYVPGGTYFFTCVTYRRRPILTTELGRHCLRTAINDISREHPFEMVAVVLLPDHWHTVWTLPGGDDRYPLRWMRIKEEFTKAWLEGGGTELRSHARETNIANAEFGTSGIGSTPSATKRIWRMLRELHPLESAKAQAGIAGPRLAVVLVSPICRRRRVRNQLGWHRSNARLERPRMGGADVGWDQLR